MTADFEYNRWFDCRALSRVFTRHASHPIFIFQLQFSIQTLTLRLVDLWWNMQLFVMQISFPEPTCLLVTWAFHLCFHYAKDSGNQMERSVSVSSDRNIRVLSIMLKIPEISVAIQTERFVSVSSDRNIRTSGGDHIFPSFRPKWHNGSTRGLWERDCL